MSKSIFLSIFLVVLCTNGPAQKLSDSLKILNNRELALHDLKQSKNRKTVGWILLGTGAGFALIGASQAKSDIFTESSDGVIPLAIATLSSIASVSFFISAGRKKKMAEILLHNQNIPLTKLSGSKLVSVGITLPLGK
jgi:hypothetical protein